MVQSRHVAGDNRWVAGDEPVPAGEPPERRPQTWVRRPPGADRSHPNLLPTDEPCANRWCSSRTAVSYGPFLKLATAARLIDLLGLWAEFAKNAE